MTSMGSPIYRGVPIHSESLARRDRVLVYIGIPMYKGYLLIEESIYIYIYIGASLVFKGSPI